MLTSTADEMIDLQDGTQAAVRVYRGVAARSAPLVLHLRGGAFLGLDPATRLAASLAGAGAVVVSADYPTGAAHPFPAALEAMYTLLQNLYGHRTRWVSKSSPLFVAGEQAGGNLAAALALMARDRGTPPLAGQILLSPMLDAGMATCSFRDAEAGPVGCIWADGWRAYLGAPEQACHPYAAPAGASRLMSLPPALMLTVTDDPMRDEALTYAGRLRAAGVAVHDLTLPATGCCPDAPVGATTQPGPTGQIPNALAEFFAAATATTTTARSRT